MAKRFTDTSINRKAWYRKLTPRLKCAWRFLCDECDHAGVWDLDLDALQFYVGGDQAFTVEELLSAFTSDKESRIIRVGERKIYIPGFIEFQYGCHAAELNPENKVHQSVILRLKKIGAYKELASPMQGAKDKDKEKDRDKDREKDKEEESECGAIKEFLDEELEILLRTVPKETQRSWLKEIGNKTVIKADLFKALQWRRDNPHKAPPPNMGAWLTTWLRQGREWKKPQPPKEPTNPFAGLAEAIAERDKSE